MSTKVLKMAKISKYVSLMILALAMNVYEAQSQELPVSASKSRGCISHSRGDGGESRPTEIDGICYNLDPNGQVAEVSHLHYYLGEINGGVDYRFAPENHSTGEECYAVPMDIWERLKTEPFYVTVKGDNPMIYLADGWWTNMFTGNYIQPGNELLTDNGDGTWTLTVNFAGNPILCVIDDRHLLFTGSGYSVVDIYLKGFMMDDGTEDEQEITIT